MKHKTSLLLMEQLIMVLIFALAAALCLNLLAKSREISLETARREEAAFLAQNAAELLKTGGDPNTLDMGDLTLTIDELPSPVPGYLTTAAITVSFEGEHVFYLEAGWQEGSP